MEESPVPTLYVDLVAEFPLHLKEALEKGLSFISGSAFRNLTLERITAGNSSSQLYRFSTASEDFVLKILDLKSCVNPSIGLAKRRNEIGAHKRASQLGAAPKLIYSDPKSLISIMHYVAGRPLCHGDLQDKTRLEQLARLLKCLHSASPSLPVRKAQLTRATEYYNQAQSKGVAFPSCFAELFEGFVRQVEECQPADLTFNHGDLHPGNILLTGDRCFFIDWAYASMDHQLSDIAYLTLLSGMNRSQTRSFLNFYLERAVNDNDLELLVQAQANSSLLLATALFNFSGTEEELKKPMKERIERLNALLESSELRTVQYYIAGTECIHPRQSHPSDLQLCALAFLKECIKSKSCLYG